MSRQQSLFDSDDEDNANAMDVDLENNNGHRNNSQQQRTNAPSSSATQAQHQALQQQLATKAGVRPSHCWLDQCLLYLQSNGGNTNNNANRTEEIWNQILHADLRDVVRVEEPGNNNDNSSSNGTEITAAMQLRRAILQSKQTTTTNGNANNNPATNNTNNNSKYESHKATLPSNFQLLIQMEEVIDVTMNGEQQLAAMGGGGGTAAAAASNNSARNSASGNNTNSGPQQNHTHRNPKYRCLKMAFSDGHHANGKTSSSSPSQEEGKENNHHPLIFAMETSPINNLSTSSPPGLKLLLHGPMDVRLGLLQVNDENCTVIGGEIESWKEVWTRAKEKAQREKGLGVDPTMKALVWNPLMGDEEEADEGEGESGDVTAEAAAATAPPPPPPILQAPPPPPQPIIAPNQSTTQPNSNIHTSSQNQNQSQTSHTTNAPSRGTGRNNLVQRTLDAYPKKPRPETTRLLPKNNNASSASTVNRSRPAAQQNASNNPYQRPSNNTGGRIAQSTNRAPPQQQQPAPPPPPVRNNTNIIPIDDSPPSSASHTSSMQQPQQQRVQANPYASLRPSTAPPAAPPPTSNSATTTTTTTSTPPVFTSNPSFSELKSILQSLRSNRTLYEQYYDKIITVPCKMDAGPSKVFNIVKAAGGDKKKSKLKKEKKYEFLLVGRFLGPKQSDGAIACRVVSSIFETYFDGYTPAEIRKLSREDKDRANRIVNQSSSQFVHDFSSLGQFQMKLLLTADEFFGKMPSSSDWLSDTANPFLCVVKRT